MITNKNIEKYLWITAVIFVTYLLLGSFILSNNFVELGYLIILYSVILIVKLTCSKE